MRFVHKSKKGFLSLLLVLALIISAVACAATFSAADVRQLGQTLAGNYYLWGLNTNDPDFGAMKAPTGSFSYDGVKGYYYYDLHGASGDYCFVISTVSNSGATAQRTPAVGGVAESGRYFLTQGNYHGYACLHLWNPAGEDVRIYFKSTSSGLYAVPLSSFDDDPTGQPTSPSSGPTAPTSAGGDMTLYCKNEAGWDAVYAYLWDANGHKNAEWPGVKMTPVKDDLWQYSCSAGYDKIIFNIGSSAVQTADLTVQGDGMMYNNATDAWSVYGDAPQPPTVPPTAASDPAVPTQATAEPTDASSPTAPAVPEGAKAVYLEDAAGWGSAYAYLWNGSGDDNNRKWPGEKMTKISGNIWRYVVPGDYKKIVFNIGSSATQTRDMAFPGYGYIYNNKTEKWSVYDTSPLQVESYATDLPSPQFVNTDVVLTASAQGEGDVLYQFSAAFESNAPVIIQSYDSNNRILWTPGHIGTYTLIYEFKDSAGNTNKRTVTFKTTEAVDIPYPYILQVRPYNGAKIQQGAKCHITALADGGNVNTKLLFYKYTVKDANGLIINVPYYTRSTSYSFFPSKLGQYSVTVSVQGSDNSTIERTYPYFSVSDTHTEPEATEPTAVFIGDADSDGKVTILDATRIQRYLAALVMEHQIHKGNADADRDGKVTILDATHIQRFLAGLVKVL